MKIIKTLIIIAVTTLLSCGAAGTVRAETTRSLLTEFFANRDNWDYIGDVDWLPKDADNPLDTGEIRLIPTADQPVASAQLARYGGESIIAPVNQNLMVEWSVTQFHLGDRWELEYRTHQNGNVDLVACIIEPDDGEDGPQVRCHLRRRTPDGEEQELREGYQWYYLPFRPDEHYVLTLSEDTGHLYLSVYLRDDPSLGYHHVVLEAESEASEVPSTQLPKFVISSDMVTAIPSARLDLHWVIYGAQDFMLSLDADPLYQTDPAWASEYLGHSDHVTIGSHGCLLTALTMLLRYYGYYQLPDETQLTPASLNAWLRRQPDGYVNQTYLNIAAVTRLTNYAHALYKRKGLNYPKLEYTYKPSYAMDYDLNDPLVHYQPYIQEVPGHFVLGRGFRPATVDVKINDPYYPGRTSLLDYATTKSRRLLTPSFTDQSYLIVNIVSRGEIHAHAKLAGEIIPDVWAPFDDPESSESAGVQLLLPKPASGDYEIWVSSDDPAATYSLFAYNTSGEVATYHPEMLRVDGSSGIAFHYERDAEEPEAMLQVTDEPDTWTLLTKDSRWRYAFTRLTAQALYERRQYWELDDMLTDYHERGLLDTELHTQIHEWLAPQL